MSDPKKPVPGDKIIDASDYELVDITPDQILRLIKFHDGSDKALANCERLKEIERERAGINEKDFQTLLGLIAEYRGISALLPAADKLAELLYETSLERAHRISLAFGEICAQARRRATRDPKGAEILGPLQDLLDYQFGPARAATATRAKNAKNAPGSPAVRDEKPQEG